MNLLRHLTKLQKPILRTLKTQSYVFNKTYMETHEWILKENDYYKFGLSQYAMGELGELVYMEFQIEKGDIIEKGGELVVIESIKATETMVAPFDCEIIDTNINLEDNIELLVEIPECENESWFLKIKKS